MTDRERVSALPEPFPEPVLLAYHAAVGAAFRAALAARQTRHVRDYRIGGHVVRLESPDAEVLATMGAALEHLQVEPQPSTALTIGLWHGVGSGAPPPPWGWYARHHGGGRMPTLHLNGHGELAELCSRRLYTAFRLRPFTLRVLDVERNHAFYWTEHIGRIPDYEYCAPLRKILAWWMSTRGQQIVHAAAVGLDAGGVLLAGRGGAGKSTSALACLGSALRYAGDDCCLVTPGDTPRVASLYNSAKLKTAADVERFPELAGALQNAQRRGDEKAIFLLHRHRPDWLSAGFPLRALLVPHVSARATARLVPLSHAEGLAALAPSTLRLFPGVQRDVTRRILDVVARVPCYRLEVGPDLGSISVAIRELLEGA